MAERRRAARVTSRIREELASTLRREIRDPRLASVLVTRVEAPDDLQLATVYVRLEIGSDDPASRKAALQGLKAATGRLRRSLAGSLGLRYTPDLRFVYDSGVEAESRVEELLHEIKRERGE